jgi:hypothetical protein
MGALYLGKTRRSSRRSGRLVQARCSVAHLIRERLGCEGTSLVRGSSQTVTPD